jgi:hypothetical protein
LEETIEEVFFVNILHEVGLDFDDEMERELEKTLEAVEACIRRRAKRVGVSVAGPEGRRMSEAERDHICEMIGDEPGERAKRRKEIEKMSEEDIQVEIKKVEAAMTERVKSAARRGQGFSVGMLPLVVMVLNLIGTRCVCGIRQDREI